jgi:hypothetical protein
MMCDINVTDLEIIEPNELTFEAPAGEQPLVVNPDVWVNAVIRDQLVREEERRQTKRIKRQNRPRIVAPLKPLVCVACMFGQHRKCAENGCPCVHKCLSPRPARNHEHNRQAGESMAGPVPQNEHSQNVEAREDRSALDTSAEDSCWPV